MSEPPVQGSQAVPQLQYATRLEVDHLLQAYRLVGWYYLLTAMAAVVSGVALTFALVQTGAGRWPTLTLQMLGSWGPAILPAVGAVGMVRGRAWGAWVIIVISGLRVLLTGGVLAYQVLLANQSSSPGSWFAVSSAMGSVLSSCLSIFLPYVFWRLCRSRGAWAQMA